MQEPGASDSCHACWATVQAQTIRVSWLSDHNLENLAFSNAFYIKTYPNESYQWLSYSVRLSIHHYFQRVTKLNVWALHVLLY